MGLGGVPQRGMKTDRYSAVKLTKTATGQLHALGVAESLGAGDSFRRAAPLDTKGNSMLKRFREEELPGRPLSEKQKREIARAQSASDEEIDTSALISSKPVYLRIAMGASSMGLVLPV